MKLLIDITEETYKEVNNVGLFLCPRDKNDLVTAIRNAKEVIQCKDCRYRFKNKWFCCDGRCLDDDNYCNYGEKGKR